MQKQTALPIFSGKTAVSALAFAFADQTQRSVRPLYILILLRINQHDHDDQVNIELCIDCPNLIYQNPTYIRQLIWHDHDDVGHVTRFLPLVHPT